MTIAMSLIETRLSQAEVEIDDEGPLRDLS